MNKPFSVGVTFDREALATMTPIDVWLYAERRCTQELGERPVFLKVLVPKPERILPIHTN